MYVPPTFQVEDSEKLAAFIQRHSFATLITSDRSRADGASPFASHLPMLLESERGPQGTLVAHMARANPQWRQFAAGGEALAIFHGPHAYVSPSWYATQPAVPTWNYAAVHVYGVPTLFEDHDRVADLLSRTNATYESAFKLPWPGQLPDEYRDGLIRAIVAFELPISRIEGKFKLSQNRSPEDRQGVYAALSRSAYASDRDTAALMAEEGLVEPMIDARRATGSAVTFAPAEASDFEELSGLRIAAMRESLLRLGRFDPERSRDRLRKSFLPAQTQWILVDGQRAGFYTLRSADDGLHLDHLYVHPGCQSRGVGAFVMRHLLSQADAVRLPVSVGALRGSRANEFYRRHAFVQVGEAEWDVYYCRPAPAR
ncbi:MAG TPA: GNAT family N-acetyltransferase [Pirellulaceae bacterium]|jgi:transcriptional regulator|nr:GNAT family N-acetyltransferase [Pirellulaceae bacterium]